MVRFLNSQSLRFHSSPFKDIYSICVSFCPLTFKLQLVRNHDVIVTYFFWMKLLWKIYRSRKLNVKVISFPDAQSSLFANHKALVKPVTFNLRRISFLIAFLFLFDLPANQSWGEILDLTRVSFTRSTGQRLRKALEASLGQRQF